MSSSGRPTCFAAFASNRRRSWLARPGPGLQSAVSPNARLQHLYHPWTSYVIVPLFALANAGIVVDGDFLSRAYSSPITLGIVFGYVIGKPVGIVGRLLAGDDGSAAAASPAGRLGGGPRRRSDRRDRLHRRPADRHPGLPGRRARGGQARRADARPSRASLLSLARLPRHRPASPQHAHPRPARHIRAARRSRRCRSTSSATTCAARRRRR